MSYPEFCAEVAKYYPDLEPTCICHPCSDNGGACFYAGNTTFSIYYSPLFDVWTGMWTQTSKDLRTLSGLGTYGEYN